ncbi:response regulator transcription factor [Simiduia litorea]|uniref:response regulator transcription factor n=1 Tax=Simiduia litorea TaxID=1435348 RepID=UPI0036F316B4
MHYLLLDDDIALTETLSRSLKKRGQTVSSCHNLTELEALLSEVQFNRAIVDLKMAHESGLDAIARIQMRQPACAIVMLTGYASIVTAVEAIKRGAVQYLPKPADTDEIINAFGDSLATEKIDIAPPSVERLEWEHIQRILHELDGNISATARALNMHRRTLQRKLSKNPAKS